MNGRSPVLEPAEATPFTATTQPWWWIPRPRRRRTNTPLDIATVVVVGLIVLAAAIGPLIAPDVYTSHVADSLLPPSAAHWFGTDQQGRDVFWRVVIGARESLAASIVVVVGYSVVGLAIASLTIVGPRWFTEMVTRFIDLGLAFPSLVFALGVAAALGPSLATACIALIVTGWPLTARLLQGIMKEVVASPFVEGARVLGISRYRLIVRHVLPNSLPVLWVKWAGDIGNTVLVLGGLSFVGAGAQPPSAEWGAMVSSAHSIVSQAWWAALFPGLAIALTTAAFGLFGDIIHLRANPTDGKGR
jgi:peptide/nickel transport system permease protein